MSGPETGGIKVNATKDRLETEMSEFYLRVFIETYFEAYEDWSVYSPRNDMFFIEIDKGCRLPDTTIMSTILIDKRGVFCIPHVK